MRGRAFADYEYKVGDHTLRVERYNDGWIWRVFWKDGRIETQSDTGDYSKLKRDAKAEGLAHIDRQTATHGPLFHVYDPLNNVCPRCAIERRRREATQ